MVKKIVDDDNIFLQVMIINFEVFVFQVITCIDQSEFEEITNIRQYMDKGLISGYQIRQVSDNLFNIDNCVSVTEAVRCLVMERPIGDPTKECHVLLNNIGFC